MKVTTLFICLWLLVLEAQASVEIPIHTQKPLRQQVDIYGELLEKEVTKAKNNRERYSTLSRVLRQIKSLRESGDPQSASDEAHMNLLVSVLESLPMQKNFKKKECAKYETEFLNQFEPTADDTPQDPAVTPGWAVLQSLCK